MKMQDPRGHLINKSTTERIARMDNGVRCGVVPNRPTGGTEEKWTLPQGNGKAELKWNRY